jgi:hypothetical protein
METGEQLVDNQNLDETALLALGSELGKQFDNGRAASAILRDKVRVWRDQYEGILPAKPVAWSSNIHVPSTKSAISSISANVAQALTAQEPYFEVEALTPDAQDAADDEENTLQYWNERVRFKTKIDMSVREACITGQSWLRCGVEFDGNNQQYGYGPLMAHELDARPTMRYIITEDMMLLPFTAPNFKRAKGAFAKTMLRWNDLVGSKGFYKAQVDALKSRWQETNPTSQTHEQQGIDEVAPDLIWAAEFECWEGIYRWVKPGENKEREWYILVAWNSDTGGRATVLMCKPYHDLYGDQWFFIPIISDPKPNSMIGGSKCEDIRGLQNWMNATFNQSTDAVTMAIMPPLLCTPGSEVYRRNMEWGPAKKWPVSNPATDVQMMQVPGSVMAGISSSMGQMGFVREMIQQVLSVSELNMNQPLPDRRTAFEVSAIVNAGSQQFLRQIGILQIGLEEGEGLEGYANCMANIINRFLPNEPIVYRAPGDTANRFRTMQPGRFAGQFRYIPSGGTVGMDPTSKMQRAGATLQQVMQSPFTQISPLDTPESVMAKVKRLYKATSDALQAMGHKHVQIYLGAEPQNVEEAIAIAAILNPQAVQLIAAKLAGGGGQGPPQLMAGEMVPPGAESPGPQGLGVGGEAGGFGAEVAPPNDGFAIPSTTV